VQAYEAEAPSVSTIRRWYEKFDEGIEDLRSSTPVGRSINHELIPVIQGLIEERPWLSDLQKTKRSELGGALLQRLRAEEANVFEGVISMDESWIPWCIPQQC
jgi:hypothetical protein